MRFSVLLTGVAALAATSALAQTLPGTPVPAPSPTASATPVPTPTPGAVAPDAAAPAAVVAVPAGTTLVQPAVGVSVFDPAGAKVGTIKTMADGFATLTTAKGDVRLATSSIGPGPNGAVIGGTAAEIEAAAAKAAAAQPATRPSRRR